jgi:TPR repeat protein/serine/threonine protein kinase
MELAPGQPITPRIQLVEPLGEGGMGTVWVAHHQTLDRKVAVKFVSGSVAGGNLLMPEERFSREAKAAAQIKSPHVVHMYDHGVMDDGRAYIVMELLEGVSLSDHVKQHGPLGLADVVRLVSQVAKALGKAHELGIVHRDIKPDNLFLESSHDELFVKVLDFGIAKLTNEAAPGGAALTAAGIMVGSPYFMSPEQMEDAKNVGVPTDVYSLAAVAYYALTATLPFDGDTPVELWEKKRRAAFAPPSRVRGGLPADIDAWCQIALAPDTAKRFASPKELSAAFARAAGVSFDFAVAPLTGVQQSVQARLRGSTTQPLEDDPAAALALRGSVPPPERQSNVPRTLDESSGAALRPRMLGSTTEPLSSPGDQASVHTVPGAPLHPPAAARVGSASMATGAFLDAVSRASPSTPPPARDAARITPPPMSAIPMSSQPHSHQPQSHQPHSHQPLSHQPTSLQPFSPVAPHSPPAAAARTVLGPPLSPAAQTALGPPMSALPQTHIPAVASGGWTPPPGAGATVMQHGPMSTTPGGPPLSAGGTPMPWAPDPRGTVQQAPAVLVEPGIARPPSRREKQGGGVGRILLFVGLPLLFLGAGAAAWWFTREPPALLPRCKATDPQACHDVAVELLDQGKNTEAFRYLAVAILRDSSLPGARKRFEELRGVLEFTPKHHKPMKDKCDEGDLIGCYLLAQMKNDEPGAAALRYLESRCDAEDQPACAELGFVFETNVWGLGKDERKAVGHYRDACTGGDARGCAHLGELYRDGRGGLTKDLTQATELFEKGCDGDVVRACDGLGRAHELGDGGAKKDAAKAAKLYEQACDAHYMPGCRHLGSLYERGLGVTADAKRAAELYKEACNGDDFPACGLLGKMQRYGQGGLKADAQTAFELLKKACDVDELQACVEIGYVYKTGDSAQGKDESRAVELWKRACDGENLNGCTALASAHHEGIGGLKVDFEKAYQLYLRVCNAGQTDACASAGYYHHVGLGGASKDAAKAAELYQKACDGGSALGCSNLGVMVENGQGGMAKDPKRAIELYQKACDGGSMIACGNLGLSHEYGTGGLTKNLDKAMELYKKACDADGGETGCRHLGSLYERGTGVAKDFTRAAEYYDKACKRGDPRGCLLIGYAWDIGRGVSAKDQVKAARFYRQACEAGDADGCNNLGVLHEQGKGGLALDKKRAKELYVKACDAGSVNGCTNKRRIP